MRENLGVNSLLLTFQLPAVSGTGYDLHGQIVATSPPISHVSERRASRLADTALAPVFNLVDPELVLTLGHVVLVNRVASLFPLFQLLVLLLLRLDLLDDRSNFIV